MNRYRIVCTTQEPTDKPHEVAHIVKAGTGDDPKRASKIWTVNQVRDAIDSGDKFYTKSPSTGKEASVHKYDCSCGYKTIRSAGDVVEDNNLDNLRTCNIGN